MDQCKNNPPRALAFQTYFIQFYNNFLLLLHINIVMLFFDQMVNFPFLVILGQREVQFEHVVIKFRLLTDHYRFLWRVSNEPKSTRDQLYNTKFVWICWKYRRCVCETQQNTLQRNKVKQSTVFPAATSAKVTSCRNLIHSGVRGWQLSTKTVDSLVHQSTRGKTQNLADSQNNSQKSSATIQIKKNKPFANPSRLVAGHRSDRCCNTVTKYKSFQWMLTFAYTFTFSQHLRL